MGKNERGWLSIPCAFQNVIITPLDSGVRNGGFAMASSSVTVIHKPGKGHDMNIAQIQIPTVHRTGPESSHVHSVKKQL